MRLRGAVGILVTLALAGGAVGCSSSADAGSSGVAAGAPSKACGGFHIVVENRGSSDAAIALNDTPIDSVGAGETIDIAQWGSYPVPRMPWNLKVTRVADGTVLLMAHLTDDGTDGRRVQVGDVPVAQAELSAFVC